MTESTRSEIYEDVEVEILFEALEDGREYSYHFRSVHPPLPPVPPYLKIMFQGFESGYGSLSLSYEPIPFAFFEDNFVMEAQFPGERDKREIVMPAGFTLFDNKIRSLMIFITWDQNIVTWYREYCI